MRKWQSLRKYFVSQNLNILHSELGGGDRGDVFTFALWCQSLKARTKEQVCESVELYCKEKVGFKEAYCVAVDLSTEDLADSGPDFELELWTSERRLAGCLRTRACCNYTLTPEQKKANADLARREEALSRVLRNVL